MAQRTREVLVNELHNLDEFDLKRLKGRLGDPNDPQAMPRGHVRPADVEDLADLIINRYTRERAIPVVEAALRALGLNDAAERLRRSGQAEHFDLR